jgi:hypothetical protein
MDFLKIESTKHTPGVILDPSSGTFEFYGFSLPEDASQFYTPIIQWLQNYIKEEAKKKSEGKQYSVTFKFVYFNSSSLRYIVELFNLFRSAIESGLAVNISWHFDSDDPQMAETGRELGLVSKIPINVVPVY